MSENRQAFERFISSSPFEKDVERFPTDSAKYPWPGAYRDITVELAWECWREATFAQAAQFEAQLAAAKAKIKQLETPTHFFADDGDCTSEAVEAAIESSVSSWGAEGCGFVEVGCLRELPARLYKVWYEDDLLKFELCEGE